MYPKNAWYVACTPDEIDEKPLGRRICGEPIVFFRGPEGVVAAVEDWCPHRGAPLSLGRVIEGKLVCGYHGLEMGCDGQTISMPVLISPTGSVLTPTGAAQASQAPGSHLLNAWLGAR